MLPVGQKLPTSITVTLRGGGQPGHVGANPSGETSAKESKVCLIKPIYLMIDI